MNNTIEIKWKTIKNFPNYKINNFGNVLNIKRNRILKIDNSNGRGYCNVTLYKERQII